VLALETLQKQWPQNEEARSTLEMIRRNIDVESHLIDDLLDLTRISKGKLELSLITLDAHAEVRNVVEMCQAEAEAKNIRVQVNLRAADYHVAADEARFQQIIWNLLKNAFKFSRQSGKVMISSTNESPHQLTISVQDQGIGIPPDAIERIFDPFEQGERSLKERFGGLGLGLAICKSLAQAHGASLIAKSDGINRGATFSLTIRTVPPAPQVAGPEKQPQLSTRSFRILLVDDHADTCATLQKLLETRGHKVTATHDMHSALDRAERDHFDLIISDVGLPDGNGTELMTRLGVDSRIRGIAISGFGTNADRERSLAAGFSEHLVKPITMERLEVAIQAALAS
jgi:two-component system, chemotaxis family, CheB/CheR fusion protein